MRNKTLLIFTIFFTVSLIIHFYKFPKVVSFDADQEYYAQKYQEIVIMGKPTLIGIPTSVGGMFVGPLYTYFSTLIYYLFRGEPIGIYIVTLVISSLNSPLTFLLFSRLKNKTVGILGGIISLFSFTLWSKAFAPSVIQLLYPMGLFFFYFLSISIKKKKYSPVLILLFALTFQIHFSLFLLFPVFFIIVLWKRRKIKFTKRYFAFIFIAVFFSILPLILFDLRHDHLITKNATGFVAQNSTGNSLNLKSFRRLSFSFWNFSSHLFFTETNIITNVFILLIVILFLIRMHKNDNFRVSAIFLVVTFILFFFYKGSVPDYYYLFLAPVIFYLVSEPLALIFIKPFLKWPVYFFLLFLVFQNIKVQANVVNPYNFFIKLRAMNFLKSQSQNKPVRVLLDTDLGLEFGFDYLMDYVGIVRTNDLQAPTYQISLRYDRSIALAEFKEKNLPVGVKIKAL